MLNNAQKWSDVDNVSQLCWKDSLKLLTPQSKLLDLKTRRSKYSTYDRRRDDRTRVQSHKIH